MITRNALEVGALLREARVRKGMSQPELAEMVGVSRQWVIAIEQGAPNARVDLVLRALRCVDLLVDIIEDEDT